MWEQGLTAPPLEFDLFCTEDCQVFVHFLSTTYLFLQGLLRKVECMLSTSYYKLFNL